MRKISQRSKAQDKYCYIYGYVSSFLLVAYEGASVSEMADNVDFQYEIWDLTVGRKTGTYSRNNTRLSIHFLRDPRKLSDLNKAVKTRTNTQIG